MNADKATDWVAMVISSVVALSVWGVLVYQYIQQGTLSAPLMGVATLFVALSVITLFGYEKVNKALELKK